MKILIATDSFKGSYSARMACDLIAQVLPGEEVYKFPMADGGEGTLEAMGLPLNGKMNPILVKDPLGRAVASEYLTFGETAIVEMARSSGLYLLEREEWNPHLTTSFGLGETILAALDRGFKKIIVAIGGSATNDGGTGMLEALGVTFYDDQKMPLKMCGENLSRIETMDLDHLDPRIKETSFEVMCDVKNPLTGPNGATWVYGPQKGGNTDGLALLEKGMEHYKSVVIEKIKNDFSDHPGAGAAGGVGFALMTFFGATLRSGIEMVLDLVEFDVALEDADLVITGEGRLDHQSVNGKVIFGICNRCHQKNVPVIAIVGSLEKDFDGKGQLGLSAVFPLTEDTGKVGRLETELKKMNLLEVIHGDRKKQL